MPIAALVAVLLPLGSFVRERTSADEPAGSAPVADRLGAGAWSGARDGWADWRGDPTHRRNGRGPAHLGSLRP
ncbi:hypothetical protein GCM10029978_093460 [Actinoallomurus acanthiterrae]